MNKLKYISGLVLAIAITGMISLDVSAQRGGRGGGGGSRGNSGGGGRSFSSGNSGGGRSFSSGNSGNFRPSSGGNNFRPGNSSPSIRPNNSVSYRPGNGGNFRPGTGNNFRPNTFTPRYNGGGNRTIVNVGIGNRGYYGGGYRGGYNNYYRPAYRPYYGGHGYYSGYYRFNPFYYSPFSYAHFGPSFGFRLSVLPFGYYPFYMGQDPYYYYDGIYYRPYADGGYEVTQPPLGATVKHLPSGAKATVINGTTYYELGGTFYQEQINAKNKVEYVVVGTDGVVNTMEKVDSIPQSDASPNAGAPDQQQQAPVKLSQVPANSKVVTVNQQKYYLSPDGIYYQEVLDADNNVSYEAVGGGTVGPAPNVN